jgi:hypothetical protein
MVMFHSYANVYQAGYPKKNYRPGPSVERLLEAVALAVPGWALRCLAIAFGSFDTARKR